MVRDVGALVAKSEDMSSTPRIDMVERENRLQKVVC